MKDESGHLLKHFRNFKYISGAMILFAGLIVPAFGQPYFSDVSDAAGMVAPHRQLTNYYVTGQAWGDVNRDGWLDLYLTNANGANKLYQNNGDGTFRESPFAARVALSGAHSGGASFADYDNDGWLDLYVLNFGKNRLFHNNAGSGFTDVTDAAGVGDEQKGQTAAWGDFDNDGDLDLYVANWACENCLPGSVYRGNRDRFYQNNGDGTFTDISHLLGESDLEGAGFVASFLDVDNDGDLDIYLVNDEVSNAIGNKLWRNDGPGCNGWCFTEISKEAGANQYMNGMGLAIGDYDLDGDLDMFASNLGLPLLLQSQIDRGLMAFKNVTLSAIPDFDDDDISWGTFFFDFDNDRWPDIFLAGGQIDSLKPMRSFLFQNRHDDTFSDVSLISGLDDPLQTIGAAYGDFDRDGWMDVVSGNRNDGYKLFRNNGREGAGNHWISVELSGGGPINRNAIGSRVYLFCDDGKRLMREVKCGSSHGAGNQLALHFGLGKARIDSLKVRWTDGSASVFGLAAPDHFWRIAYPDTVIFEKKTRRGWNLIGVPFKMRDARLRTAFPSAALDSLLAYRSGYVRTDSLAVSRGYWIHAQEPVVAPLNGEFINEIQVELEKGWNLISGVSGNITSDNISDPENLILPGSMYEYRGGYQPADVFNAGSGYWLRARADGKITFDLSRPATDAPVLTVPRLDEFPHLIVSDARRGRQTLYFGVDTSAIINVDDYLLPPMPPGNQFDARFNTGYRAIPAEEAFIILQTTDYPVTIAAENLPQSDSHDILLSEMSGSAVGQTHPLTNGKVITITDNNITRLKLSRADKSVDTYMLEQNYPNPFNPSTFIRYALPEKSFVRLTIFNALGQRVKTLVAQEKDGGLHIVNWDGRNDFGAPVSSGVYLYQMKTAAHVSVKKMLLLR